MPRFDNSHVASPQQPEFRSLRRKRLLRSGLAGGVERAVTLTASVTLLAVVVRELPSEEFGLFASLIALNAALVFADFGLGQGLVTSLASSSARADDRAQRTAITTTFGLLLAIGALLALGAAALLTVADVPAALGVPGPLQRPAQTAMMGYCLLVAVALPMVVAESTQRGLQLGYIASTWRSAGIVLQTIVVSWGAVAGFSLAALIIMWAAAPALVSVVNFAWFFIHVPSLRPRRSSFNLPDGILLIRNGGYFFGLQVGYVLLYGLDTMILLRATTPNEVSAFAITSRLFYAVPPIVSLAMLPLIPAYTDAMVRGDHAWLVRTYRRSALMAVGIAASASGLLFLAGGDVELTWAGRGGLSDRTARAALGVWIVVHSAHTCMSYCLTGLGAMRSQVVVTLGAAAVVVVAKVVGAQSGGSSGLLVYGTFCYAILILPASMYLIRRQFKLFNTERTDESRGG